MDNLTLEFSDDVLRILILDDSGKISFKDETDLGFNMNDYSYFKNRDELVDNFNEKFNGLLKEPNLVFKEAGVLIDTSQAFLNVFPVDFQEDAGSINSHILWELSNYFPETYKNYNIKYYRLNNQFLTDGIDQILLIAVDKNKIEFIKSLCNGCGIKIKSVDIDQFVVEKCLKVFYPEELKNSTLLLIGCKNSRLDFSLISGGTIKYYDYEIINTLNFTNLLVKQMNFYNSVFEVNRPGKIFLYGDRNAEVVKKFLNEEFPDLLVQYINPVDTKDTKDTKDNNKNFSKFSPLFGLALKNLSKKLENNFRNL
ncbi:MAG: hypothetical protein ABIY50_10405 [Ignavibacteria bacterium]